MRRRILLGSARETMQDFGPGLHMEAWRAESTQSEDDSLNC